jgi:PhnB protein
MTAPGGRGIWHAELRIGDSVLYINDAMPGGPHEAPGPGRKPTAAVQIYVPDVDATFDRAVKAGATPGMPVADQFWGDRMGFVIDPFGQTWGILTRVKAMSETDMRKAGEEFAARMAEQQNAAQPAGASAVH